MMPTIGQHVKCILRNGAIAEGIVEEWKDTEVQLKSLDGESILIITHPSEDIMLIKIVLEKITTVEESENLPTEAEVQEFESHFQEVADTTDPHDVDQIKSLAQLRIELNKQERRIIAQRLREHRPSEARKVNYGYPGFIKKPSTK